jgi:hypothetical protein
MVRGMRIPPPLVMGALRRSRSMRTPRHHAIPMRCRAASWGCVCLRPSSSIIRDCYRAQRFQCPLLFPEKTGQTCDHEQFAKGKGCVKDVNWELGGIQRVTLDRDGPLFHALYNQRTGCERINARAKELGIERPRVRNRRSVANLNTLIYVIVNVRV